MMRLGVTTVNTVLAIAPTQHTWIWRDSTITFTVEGDGIPLVLVHGFGASIGHWRHNIPALAAAGYRVYALDLLGFGASDKPALDYSLDLWETLLQDFWQAHVQQPAVWIGNSIGALLSLMLVTRTPDLSRAGILLNCAGGLNHRPEEMGWPLGLVMSTFSRVVASPTLGPFLFNQVRRKSRIRGTLKQVYANKKAVTDELVDILHRPSCDPGAQQVFASILNAPAGIPPEELLPTLERPLLVLWGDRDPWTPIQRGQAYSSYSPLVEFQAIPNAGHCPHDEWPEVVNPLMINWLNQLP